MTFKCQGQMLVSDVMAIHMRQSRTCIFILLSILIVTDLSESKLNREDYIRRNEVLKETVQTLENTINQLERELKKNDLDEKLTEQKVKELLAEPIHREFEYFRQFRALIPSPYRRQILSEYNVAFSVYLDHDIDHLGDGQAILFNQILLNDGGGYNKHIGAFIVPMDGIYFFSFFVGQRGINQVFASLTVNGVEQSHAVAETSNKTGDAQGGNIAILKLAQGDVAQILHERHSSSADSHIEGEQDVRLSTFSGFLISNEDTNSILGK